MRPIIRPQRQLDVVWHFKRRPNEDPEKIVKRHIELLHKYNEAKDATQVRFSVFVSCWKAPLIRNFSRVGLCGLDFDRKGGRLNHFIS
jgi:hypothetical protein